MSFLPLYRVGKTTLKYAKTLESCKSRGAAAAQEVEQVVQEIRGSIPSSSSPHVNVCLGKILNPKLLQIACVVPYGGWVGSPHCQCVNEVNVTVSYIATFQH